jgi:hypothetical protein
LAQKKQSLLQTLQLIVDILSNASSPAVLIPKLNTETVDWEEIVKVASNHLVLPAIYCRLQQQSLLAYIPEDLNLYLEELTSLNRDRNKTLLIEAQLISKLFESHKIDHVFIKGIALIAGNYFEDQGERMIGDIDILVASKDLDRAFGLLVGKGYSQFITFNYVVKNYRHLPRQVSKTRLGAIELHDQLLKHRYQKLIDKDALLMSKTMVNGIAIPNSEFLIWNTILAHQINDKSYYYNNLKIKGLYDLIVMRLDEKRDLLVSLSKQKHSFRFLNLSSVFYPQIKPKKEGLFSDFYKQLYMLQLKFPIFGRRFHQFKSLNTSLSERLQLFLFNKSYRKHVLKNKLIK